MSKENRARLIYTRYAVSKSGLTDVYSVQSVMHGFILGDIKWYAPWRRYVFNPREETVFDVSCLEDIASFITQLMEERNIARKQARKAAKNHA